MRVPPYAHAVALAAALFSLGPALAFLIMVRIAYETVLPSAIVFAALHAVTALVMAHRPAAGPQWSSAVWVGAGVVLVLLGPLSPFVATVGSIGWGCRWGFPGRPSLPIQARASLAFRGGVSRFARFSASLAAFAEEYSAARNLSVAWALWSGVGLAGVCYHGQRSGDNVESLFAAALLAWAPLLPFGIATAGFHGPTAVFQVALILHDVASLALTWRLVVPSGFDTQWYHIVWGVSTAAVGLVGVVLALVVVASVVLGAFQSTSVRAAVFPVALVLSLLAGGFVALHLELLRLSWVCILLWAQLPLNPERYCGASVMHNYASVPAMRKLFIHWQDLPYLVFPGVPNTPRVRTLIARSFAALMLLMVTRFGLPIAVALVEYRVAQVTNLIVVAAIAAIAVSVIAALAMLPWVIPYVAFLLQASPGHDVPAVSYLLTALTVPSRGILQPISPSVLPPLLVRYCVSPFLPPDSVVTDPEVVHRWAESAAHDAVRGPTLSFYAPTPMETASSMPSELQTVDSGAASEAASEAISSVQHEPFDYP